MNILFVFLLFLAGISLLFYSWLGYFPPKEISLSEAALAIEKSEFSFGCQPSMIWDNIWIRNKEISFLLQPYYQGTILLEVHGLGLTNGKWALMNGPTILLNPDGTPVSSDYSLHDKLNIQRIWDAIYSYRNPKEIVGQGFD